ncbi:MAG: orotidine-5'-phosphate decarboxylase [bacterium]|nr:orotidine-5'-phosphate decarboxylase [bacterium]
MSNRIILAADNIPIERCVQLGPIIGERAYAIKVHELYDRHGPKAIARLKNAGWRRVWDDAKLHDIPNTVKLRARAIAHAGADISSVHAKGEVEMMMAAKESGAIIFAITELTSLSEEQIHLLSGQPSKASVLYLARLAKLAEVDGVVSSALEVNMLTKRPELIGLKRVTPGLRSAGKETHDQQRVDTPTAALKNGSDLLVIGRQLTEASDVAAAYDELEQEIARALPPGSLVDTKA